MSRLNTVTPSRHFRISSANLVRMNVNWAQFQKQYFRFDSLGLSIDLSRLNEEGVDLEKYADRFEPAFDAMAALEKGSIANPDEKRMVGHYWLRAPELAPDPKIRAEIENTVKQVHAFASKVHDGEIQGERGPFKNLLLIGIGGSALGPQFVTDALGHPATVKLSFYTFDNTDPDGMDKVLSSIVMELGQTLCLVISKSGGTKETRNGMLEAQNAWKQAGLSFSKHAVAVTGSGSELDKYAQSEKWMDRFPMWDWVGGRTSETSAVGLLPAALMGFDIAQFLKGAADCDKLTRIPTLKDNPSALLALSWLVSGNVNGSKNMVVLPYKDRLQLFSKYLQQLVMESLGKEFDLSGNKVDHGITVFGNKGSTDQHAYIQQLRDGPNDFFATFIVARKSRSGPAFQVEPNVTSGDYLHGFYLGTREALFEKSKSSITLTVPEINAYTVGLLIALYERAVGLFASLVKINAYHQPGVEAGKKAATAVLAIHSKLLSVLGKEPKGIQDLAQTLGANPETIFHLCEHLSANPESKVKKLPSSSPFDGKYTLG